VPDYLRRAALKRWELRQSDILTSMQKRRRSGVIWVILTIAVIVVPILGLVLYDKHTLPDRLILSTEEIVVHKNLFTKSKLIESHEEMWFNPNGDGSIDGTFQFSENDMRTLASADSWLKCPGKPCELEARSDGCEMVDKPGGTMYELCVDESKNRVRWSVVWY
jgi:hypothetical protein